MWISKDIVYEMFHKIVAIIVIIMMIMCNETD